MGKTFLTLLLIVIVFGGCTKDDICSETTLTTPLLIIDFRDINDRATAKAVEDLQVLVNDADSTVVYSSISDTIISIPLNTESNQSSFHFIFNASDVDNLNDDIVTFTYTREEVYVNRACAFRMVYNDLLIAVEPENESDFWILDTDINNPTLENENEAHITVYH